MFADIFRVMLDAFSRRHEGQKIYLRQEAAQRWIGWRDQVLRGERPHSGHTQQLNNCDAQLRVVSANTSEGPPGNRILTLTRNSQPSQTILSIPICDPMTIRWGGGLMKIPVFDTSKDGSEPGAESNTAGLKEAMGADQRK